MRWDRLLFCAKEAVFKAWWPLARRPLGFDAAAVTLDAGGRFEARLTDPGVLPGEVRGRWGAGRGATPTPARLRAAVRRGRIRRSKRPRAAGGGAWRRGDAGERR